MTSRRDFLIGSLAMLGTTAVHAAPTEPAIIDTHTHFYDPERPQGVPWPGKDDKSLYRRVLPEHFKLVAAPMGVTGTVVVEASSWLEDNQWVLDLATNDPFVLGLVGNLNPGTDPFAGHVKRFAANPVFRGIRVNSGPLKMGLERPEYLRDLGRLVDADLELDINGGPELLPLVHQVATKLPELRIVINHLANVKIDGPDLNQEWLAGMKTAARHERVFLKVSALVESASRDGKTAPRDPAFYVPILESMWQTFGADRLIYGSNWPVSERAADYGVVLRIVKEFFATKGTEASAKFFATNAKAAYQWPDRKKP